MVQQTSLEAYIHLINHDKLTGRRREVFEVIKENPGVCDKEISKILNWSINRVTPRRGELEQFGFIIEDGEKHYDGFKARTWKAVEA